MDQTLCPIHAGEYTVDGLYIEFLVPLVSGLPFVQDLTFETAYRVDDFSTAGNVSASKYGLNWTINDDWRFRSVVAESVRAPNIDDLYAGQAQTYSSINDPCRNLGTDGQSSNATVVANCLSFLMLQLLLLLVPITQIQEQLYLVLFTHNQTFKPSLVL